MFNTHTFIIKSKLRTRVSIAPAMGFFLFDYFRCEPFELNFRIFTFGGFWPLETDVRWKKILFSIFSYLCYFSETSLLSTQFLDLFLLRNDFERFTSDLCTISLSFVITAKSLLIVNKTDMIFELKRKFTKYKNTRTDETDIEILEKSNEQILKIIKGFYTISVPCVVIWVLYPGLDSGQERGIPFPYRLPIPVEEWTDTIYICVYAYQSIAIVGYLINVLSVDSIFCGFVLRTTAHYEIIIKNIKKLGHGHEEAGNNEIETRRQFEKRREKESKEVIEILKENVKQHQEILKDIDCLREIFKNSSLVHFLGAGTIIAVGIFNLVTVNHGFRLQVLQRTLYVIIAIWDTFLYCFFGSILHYKSLELASEAYHSRLYTWKPEVRRYLQFIILKCQRLPKLMVGNFFPIEMKTFLNLIRHTYDITALLYQTTRKK